MGLRIFLFPFICLVLSMTGDARAVEFKVAPQNAVVGFSIQYLKFWTVKGCFNDVYGGLIIDEGSGKLISIAGDIVIESLNTGFKYRDDRLMSATYFHQQQYPVIHFESDTIDYNGDTDFVISGTITMKGISKPFVFKGKTERIRSNSHNEESTVFLATGFIDRKQFKIGPIETYHPESILISNQVVFRLTTAICRNSEDEETTCQRGASGVDKRFTCEF